MCVSEWVYFLAEVNNFWGQIPSHQIQTLDLTANNLEVSFVIYVIHALSSLHSLSSSTLYDTVHNSYFEGDRKFAPLFRFFFHVPVMVKRGAVQKKAGINPLFFSSSNNSVAGQTRMLL